MTGLIPGMAKRRGIKSLFTVHIIHYLRVLPAREEDGIDAAGIPDQSFFTGMLGGYDQAPGGSVRGLVGLRVFRRALCTARQPALP